MIALCAAILAVQLDGARGMTGSGGGQPAAAVQTLSAMERRAPAQPTYTAAVPDADGCERSDSTVPTFCVAMPLVAKSDRPSAAAMLTATGARFMEIPTARGLLLAEAALPPEIVNELAAAIDRDVDALERKFGVRFAARPYVYATASRFTFGAALTGAFGEAPRDIAGLAARSGGAFIPSPEAVVINWENVADARPISIVRHELAHLLVRQIVGAAALPFWLEEGIPALAEQDLGESLRARYVARSIVTGGRVSLGQLGLASGWPALGGVHGVAQYGVAAEAARMLRSELGGPAALTAALEEAARLGSFAAAYERITGEPLSFFVARFPARLAKDLPAHRVDVARANVGSVWTLLGFRSGETVSVVIEGQLYRAAFDVTTDEHGSYSAAFGSTAPRGTYWLLATGANGSARGVIVN